MRHLFLVNPVAGKKKSTGELIRRIEEVFGTLGLSYEIVLTGGPGDARKISREAACSGELVRIYACGGDGTLNEVVNGAAGFPNAAVTNVPKGTANDFLKIFGAEYRAGFSDLAALARGPQASFDLMDCNGRLGIGVFCAGLDARVAADVHQYADLPLVSGSLAYVLALVVNVLFKKISRPAAVHAGETGLSGETTLLCICNGRYYGGGFMPVGDAQPDDGILDMLVVPKVSRVTFFRLVGAYAKGNYWRYPQIIRAFHGGPFSFSAPEEMTAVVDGEILKSSKFTVGLAEKKIQFFYPEYLDYRGGPTPKAVPGKPEERRRGEPEETGSGAGTQSGCL